ncbi:reverse transcriptase [Phytophthora palmivora]|uniref:Reverse transcriptase n=1 Tax=Phytophthora palmivora TaxID=4796 RepID=A0A2P4X640_9STRA|nr:reverse transcriptase [Phytophthora palmivora]
MVLLKPETSPEDLNSSSVMDEDVLEGFTKQHTMHLGSEILKNPEDPVYPLVKEFLDVVPLPSERCEVIDAFFAEKAKSDMVQESKSPHSTPTFCTPVPRKDVLLNNMSGCTLHSTLDLVDGYYQILMRESDIPLTTVSTPSEMLWEWLVMPQGLSNAPTFNRLVTQAFIPLCTFTQTYFDDIFVHSRAEGGQTAMEMHLNPLRRVFEVMRSNKLYVNIDKCVFTALRTATNSSHFSQRMARWLSFFAEYNIRIEYKPGKLNVLADALSRRPDYELAHVSRVTTDLYDRIRLPY